MEKGMRVMIIYDQQEQHDSSEGIGVWQTDCPESKILFNSDLGEKVLDMEAMGDDVKEYIESMGYKCIPLSHEIYMTDEQ